MATPKNQPYTPHHDGRIVVKFGRMLENSAPIPAATNAGETKLATTLIPSVATAKVSAASSARNQLSNFAEIWSGCSSTSPYTVKAAVVVTPATSVNRIRLTGSPQMLPLRTAA